MKLFRNPAFHSQVKSVWTSNTTGNVKKLSGKKRSELSHVSIDLSKIDGLRNWKVPESFFIFKGLIRILELTELTNDNDGWIDLSG